MSSRANPRSGSGLFWRRAIRTAGGQLAIRSRYYSGVGAAPFVVFAVVILVQTWNGSTEDMFGPLVWVVVCLLFAWRLWRVALLDKGEYLLVQNVFSTRRVEWTRITAMRVRIRNTKGTYATVVFDTSSRSVSASATLTYSADRSEAICGALNLRALDLGIPTELSAQKLTSRA